MCLFIIIEMVVVESEEIRRLTRRRTVQQLFFQRAKLGSESSEDPGNRTHAQGHIVFSIEKMREKKEVLMIVMLCVYIGALQ